jgi:hypothetical protein
MGKKLLLLDGCLVFYLLKLLYEELELVGEIFTICWVV